MIRVLLDEPDDFDGWRDAARRLSAAGVGPDQVVWEVRGEQAGLFGEPADALPAASAGPLAVPKAFPALARAVVLHRADTRFALLYRMLVDLQASKLRLDDRADPLVVEAESMAKTVRRDIHKMRAFVRFREVAADDGSRYVAWFEPEHHIVRANAAFFIDRFAAMRWSILTPELSIHWDGTRLEEGPGALRGDAPDGDPVEDAWKRYYASIFNPARVKIGAMLKEMPRKYWHAMPETALIPDLIAGAQERSRTMLANGDAQAQAEAAPVAENAAAIWQRTRSAVLRCKRCPLYAPATQAVFGEGPLDAPLLLVGEQPGDLEDLAGRVFVGPAGQLLDAALEEAGVDRARLYITNAVKHFKFEPRGKRRIHARPTVGEIDACRPWLDQERALIRPRMTLALGASAARALLGKSVSASKIGQRTLQLPGGDPLRLTIHPSYVLRIPDPDEAGIQRQRLIEDLRSAWAAASA